MIHFITFNLHYNVHIFHVKAFKDIFLSQIKLLNIYFSLLPMDFKSKVNFLGGITELLDSVSAKPES